MVPAVHKGRTQDVSTVLEQLVEYFFRHPRAKDAVEGIAQWWLPSRPDRKSVQEALTVLMAEGLVIERRTLGESAIYGLQEGSEQALEARWKKILRERR